MKNKKNSRMTWFVQVILLLAIVYLWVVLYEMLREEYLKQHEKQTITVVEIT